MPFPNTPLTSGTNYDRVPGNASPIADNDDLHRYPEPPSPSHQPAGLYESEVDFATPSHPRFLGAAAHSEGPSIRESIASSQYLNSSGHSEAASSVYALNANNSAFGLNDPSGHHVEQSQTSSYDAAYRDDPSVPAGSAIPMGSYGAKPAYMDEKRAAYPAGRPKSKRRIFIIAGIVAGILLILAIVIPVIFAVVKKKDNDSDTSSGAGGASAAHPSTTGSSEPSKGDHSATSAVTGGDGSEVTMDDGSKVKYSNPYGGYWYYDEKDPYNNAAKVNSWTPALNETFEYGKNRIFGVNLGGWLNTEPFMSPALYEPYSDPSLPVPAIDEWTLSWAMANDTANGGMKQLEHHYDTFITEQDFAQIAAAGLNWIRLPVGYWMIETREGEPFLAGTSFKYFLKAIKWARKYGIRINLDLHTMPGSQNGWNHSGRFGKINMLYGPMGYANAQRSLDYIRVIAEFISQPQYSDVVPMFGIMNEPFGPTVGIDNLQKFYVEAYKIVRKASGSGKGPTIGFHDGFMGLSDWAGFLPNADNIALDYHPYMCFGGQPSTPMPSHTKRPCDMWGASMNNSMTAFGMTGAGEFSLAVTDCGKYLNGVNLGTRYEGNYTEASDRIGSCTPWTDWQNWDDTFKKAMYDFALSSMDALQNWFFWNWKIGESSVSGKIETPAWSYKLGLEQGWIPKDPRVASGACGNVAPWSGSLTRGDGNIPASATATLAWPPASISRGGAVTLLPSYTQTGAIPTLSAAVPSGAASEVKAGSGWNNADDQTGMAVPIPACNYLDPWVGPDASPPSPLCGGAAKRGMVKARITPAPVA